MQGITGLTQAINFLDETPYPSLGVTPELLYNEADQALFAGVAGSDHWVQISAGSVSGGTGVQGVNGITGTQGVTGLANFIDQTYYPTLGIPEPVLLFQEIDGALFAGTTGVGQWVQISSGSMQAPTGAQGYFSGSGFPAKNSAGNLRFDSSGLVGNFTPRTFYIDGTYSVQIQGLTYNKTSSPYAGDSVQISNTTGGHFICYNTSGTLVDLTSFDAKNVFYTNAITSYLYWNTADATGFLFEDERHGPYMPWEDHYYDHRFFHTQYRDGLGLNNITVDGATSDNSSAQFSVDNGDISDEDVDFAITNGNPQTLVRRLYSNPVSIGNYVVP